MKILLTNDDGFHAPGIQTLYRILKNNNHEVAVIAPNTERSASSHSVTLFQPLRLYKKDENCWAVSGTPADCSIIASKKMIHFVPELVISGINRGQNMGEDVLYSGTIAASLEAMYLGMKSIAVSLVAFENEKYDVAAKVVLKLLENKIVDYIKDGEILNINVPNLDFSKIKGVKNTFLGHRTYNDFVIEQDDPFGKKIYWIGGGEPEWQMQKGSDYYAVSSGFVSVTPIKPNFDTENKLDDFMKNISLI
jgi:5'-nucleotidase